MTLLEPMWLALPTGALALLTLCFGMSVRWWLQAFPVLSIDYRRHETNWTKPSYIARGDFAGISAQSAVMGLTATAFHPGAIWVVDVAPFDQGPGQDSPSPGLAVVSQRVADTGLTNDSEQQRWLHATQ